VKTDLNGDDCFGNLSSTVPTFSSTQFCVTLTVNDCVEGMSDKKHFLTSQSQHSPPEQFCSGTGMSIVAWSTGGCFVGRSK